MAETKTALVARLFAEHRGALQAFLYQRVRRRPEAAELRSLDGVRVEVTDERIVVSHK